MSLFDLIEAGLGRPDPSAQLYARLGQAPGQAGSPAGPQPLAPPPGAPAAGPGGPAGPPGPAPGPGGPAGAPGGTPGPTAAPPAPQAYTSPPDLQGAYSRLAQGPQPQPDLMQLYAAAAQRQQANEQFNRGLAGLTAAFSPLSQRASLEHEWDNMTQDPGALFSNIMNIQNYNYQQQQREALARAVPDIAKQLNMTPDEVRAAGPDAVHTALTANLPPEAMRNWTYAKRQWIASHPEDPTGAEFEKQFPMSLAITGTIPGLSDTDRQRVNMLGDWQRSNPGQTAPTWLTNTFAFQNYQKDLGDAQGNFASFNQKSQETLDALDRVKNNPKLGSALTLLSTTGGIGSNFLSQYGALDPDTKKAIDDIQLLSGQVYGDAFRSTGSRRTQQEVAAITEGLSKLGKTGYSADDYKNVVLKPIQDRIQEGMANNYGASQQLDSMPDKFKPLVNSIYLPGGSLYGGQGGDWARQPNRGVKQPSGSGGGPADFSKMSSADADAAYEKLPSGALYIGPDGKTYRK